MGHIALGKIRLLNKFLSVIGPIFYSKTEVNWYITFISKVRKFLLDTGAEMTSILLRLNPWWM